MRVPSQTVCSLREDGLIEVAIRPGDGTELVTLYTPEQALAFADVLQRKVAQTKAQTILVNGYAN